jgi:hypothetical protein
MSDPRRFDLVRKYSALDEEIRERIDYAFPVGQGSLKVKQSLAHGAAKPFIKITAALKS